MLSDRSFEPKVSIVIPVYNGANYLKDAIECALKQTYRNLEVIVVNDGSDDDLKTENIARSYGDAIRYIYKENGGVSSALNVGIREMTGEYFSWLSHDDSYSPTKIEDAVRLLRDNESLLPSCVTYTGGFFIDSNGNKIMNFPAVFSAERIYSGLDVVDVMTRRGTLNGCCMIIPRTAFEKVGGFNEHLRYSQDALMWYMLFLNGYSMVADNNKNVMYRLHSLQTSQNRRDLLEKDSLYIAKVLAPRLAAADDSGRLFFQYTMRLAKSRCRAAIAYLEAYAQENKLLSAKQKLALKTAIASNSCRYYVVSIAKKIIIRK